MHKIIKKLIISLIALILLITTYSAITYHSSINLILDETTKYQTVKGFGASAAWTFQTFGLEDDALIDQAIDMLYGSDGLSLNIYRYNIGAGSIDSALNDIPPYNNEWFSNERRSESFFIGENYIDKDSFSNIDNYDFDRDAAAQKMLDKALNTGNLAEIVFFANSPHYLMTHSGLATGEYEYQSNLREDYYEAFCDYLLIIVKYFYDSKLMMLDNIPDIYISPINEPQWRWGGAGASQEGCHYDPEQLAHFIDIFISKVNAFNLTNGTNFKADVFDSGNYKLSKITDYLNAMSEYEYMNELKHISVHSYGVNDKKYHRYRFIKYMEKNHPHLSLSMTEYCLMEHGRDNSIDSALNTGKVMLRDLSILNATDWSWWLAISNGDYNDGLVYWDDDELSVLRRYYVVGHFTRYIERGDIQIKVKSNDLFNISGIDTVAFVKPDGTRVLIVINSGKAQTIKLDSNYTISKVIATIEDYNWQEKEISNNIVLDKDSITTIIINK